jgi:hypothetical protein
LTALVIFPAQPTYWRLTPTVARPDFSCPDSSSQHSIRVGQLLDDEPYAMIKLVRLPY